MRLIYQIVEAIDNFLYRNFRVVSSTRKEKWHRDAVKIQAELDAEHSKPMWGHWIFS